MQIIVRGMNRALALGRFLAAFALCSAVATAAYLMIRGYDSWYLTGFAETVGGYVIEDLWRYYTPTLAWAAACTALLLAVSTSLLVWLKRESLVSYLAVCGALPFSLLPIANAEQEVVEFSIMGLAVGACWWFAYRRQRARGHASQRPPLLFWLVLAVACIPLAIIMRNDFRVVTAQNAPKSTAERNTLMSGWIQQAVYAQGRLWVSDHQGQLASYALQGSARQLQARYGVLDIKAHDDTVTALILEAGNPAGPDILADRWHDTRRAGRFFVQTFDKGRSQVSAKIAFPGEEWPVALAVGARGTFVLTGSALYVLGRGAADWTSIDLSSPLFNPGTGGEVTAALSFDGQRQYLYAGIDNRTYGGGKLVAIDTATGQATTIIRDDVLAIEPRGQRPGCILAGIGGAHLWFGHGKVIELCGRRMRTVLERPIVTPSSYAARQIGRWRTSSAEHLQNTEIFHQLVYTGADTVWALSSLGRYRRSGGGQWQRSSLPQFRPKDGFWISDDIPGMILVSQDRMARYGAPHDFVALPSE